MANKFSNPILGGVNIDTQPYYNALSQRKVAEDGLRNTALANPFRMESIDADIANLNSTLDPYNQQIQDLVNEPGALEDSRNLTTRIMELNKEFNRAKTQGDLSPFIQRKKDFDETASNFDNLAKGAKSNDERAHVLAQKQAFIDKQTAFSGGDPSLAYLTGITGERADYFGHVDPVKFTNDLGKRVKDDGIDLGITTEPVDKNKYYQMTIQGKRLWVDKEKLQSSIIPGVMAKSNEFARMSQVGGRGNMGIDEQGNIQGQGDQYAINTANGSINPNTELGAAITSAINAYQFSKESSHGTPLKSEYAFDSEAAAKARATKDAGRAAEANQLRLYETQENVKIDDKGNKNWSEAQVGIRAIKNKQGKGLPLSGDERSKLSSYERSKQLKAFHDEAYNKAHPERARAKDELSAVLETRFSHVSPDVLQAYVTSNKNTPGENAAANMMLGEGILADAFGDKLSPGGLEIVLNNLTKETTILGDKSTTGVFSGSAMSPGLMFQHLNSIAKTKGLSAEDTKELLNPENYTAVADDFERIVDKEADLGDDVLTKMEALEAYNKQYNKSLDTQLQADLITQGFAITPEARGKGIWDNISKSIVDSHFRGTKVAENLGTRVYKVDGGDSQYMDVDANMLDEFANSKSIEINKIIDYKNRAPQMEMRVTNKDGATSSYIVDVPKNIAGEFEQFYTESAKTPQSKRIGLAGSKSRVKDQRDDVKWDVVDTDFTTDKNVIDQVRATGAKIRSGIFGAYKDSDIKELNIYQEHLSRGNVGIKVKAGDGEASGHVELDNVLDFYDQAFEGRGYPDAKKIAPMYNFISHHLKNNTQEPEQEIVARLEEIARDPSEGSYAEFTELARSLSGLETTAGFSFPSKSNALNFLTTTPKKLEAVKYTPGK